MKFTQSHEWVYVDQGIGTVGVTHYAQRELGEVVYVELPSVGKHVRAGDEIAVLESTKAAADIYAPLSGEIVEINQKLGDFVHYINSSPQQEGWLCKIRLSDPSELAGLLDEESYSQLVK